MSTSELYTKHSNVINLLNNTLRIDLNPKLINHVEDVKVDQQFQIVDMYATIDQLAEKLVYWFGSGELGTEFHVKKWVESDTYHICAVDRDLIYNITIEETSSHQKVLTLQCRYSDFDLIEFMNWDDHLSSM